MRSAILLSCSLDKYIVPASVMQLRPMAMVFCVDVQFQYHLLLQNFLLYLTRLSEMRRIDRADVSSFLRAIT